MLRNLTPPLRSFSMGLYGWLGCITLETCEQCWGAVLVLFGRAGWHGLGLSRCGHTKATCLGVPGWLLGLRLEGSALGSKHKYGCTRSPRLVRLLLPAFVCCRHWPVPHLAAVQAARRAAHLPAHAAAGVSGRPGAARESLCAG